MTWRVAVPRHCLVVGLHENKGVQSKCTVLYFLCSVSRPIRENCHLYTEQNNGRIAALEDSLSHVFIVVFIQDIYYFMSPSDQVEQFKRQPGIEDLYSSTYSTTVQNERVYQNEPWFVNQLCRTKCKTLQQTQLPPRTHFRCLQRSRHSSDSRYCGGAGMPGTLNARAVALPVGWLGIPVRLRVSWPSAGRGGQCVCRSRSHRGQAMNDLTGAAVDLLVT